MPQVAINVPVAKLIMTADNNWDGISNSNTEKAETAAVMEAKTEAAALVTIEEKAAEGVHVHDKAKTEAEDHAEAKAEAETSV